MNDLDYKDGIRATRLGSLGGSDYQLLKKVDMLGEVPVSAYERLAVAKGLIENKEMPCNDAMRYGDFVENKIFESLGEGYESNPLWISKKYSKKNIRLICHPDFVRKDDKTKTLYVYECKATTKSVEETKSFYNGQLYIEYELGKEILSQLEGKWSIKMYLCHYDSSDMYDDMGDFKFDAEKVTILPVQYKKPPLHIDRAMNIIDIFLKGFTEYDREDITQEYLPQNIQDSFANVARLFEEIEKKENDIAEFKERMYKFMVDKNIKSIKTDLFNIVRVDESISKTFDKSKFKDKHPILYNRYLKDSKRKGYAKVTLKTIKED